MYGEVLWKLFGEQCVHKRKQKINQPHSDLEFERAEEKEADEPVSVEGFGCTTLIDFVILED
jgi:hypothetical protein